jgi:hypothetical protein
MEFADLPWDVEHEMGRRPFPKIGSAVQRSVTAVSVKKAFMYRYNGLLPETRCTSAAVMLPAHTAPKTRP